MNRTQLLSRRMEVVRSIDRCIGELESERNALMHTLCYEALSDVMRREIESDYVLLGEAIDELCVTKSIVCEKVNVQATKQPPPRLVRIK